MNVQDEIVEDAINWRISQLEILLKEYNQKDELGNILQQTKMVSLNRVDFYNNLLDNASKFFENKGILKYTDAQKRIRGGYENP